MAPYTSTDAAKADDPFKLLADEEGVVDPQQVPGEDDGGPSRERKGEPQQDDIVEVIALTCVPALV